MDDSHPGYSDAGAVFQVTDFAKLRVENSIFQHNYANYGAVFSLYKDANIEFVNNQVTNNKAALGGSLAFINYSNPRIINNTIINNEVLNQDDFHATGVIESYISKPIIYNNIIYQNSDNFFEEEQLFSAKAYHTRYNGLDFPFGYNNIYLTDLDYEISANNIYLFAPNQAIIDSATLELPFGIQVPETDLVGNARLYNTSLDMGAVELQPVSNDHASQELVELISLYPNPFNPEITIELSKTKAEQGSLTIYNIKGQVVKSFKASDISNNKIVWKGRDQKGKALASGIYLFKYSSTKQTEIKKALLVK